MAFTEDLSQFFDTENGFAVVATLKQPNGTVIRTADVIFDTPTQDVAMFAEDVAASSPFITGKAVDLRDLRDGYKVTIGSTTYRVSGSPHEDGTGVCTVQVKP